ncbi:hypothetical protein WUBG_17357, partial [Wuchereria bancrofti]
MKQADAKTNETREMQKKKSRIISRFNSLEFSDLFQQYYVQKIVFGFCGGPTNRAILKVPKRTPSAAVAAITLKSKFH